MPEAAQQRSQTSYLVTVERSLEQSIDLCVFRKLLVCLACMPVCYVFRCLAAKLITLQIFHCKNDLHFAAFSNYVAATMLVKVSLPRLIQHTYECLTLFRRVTRTHAHTVCQISINICILYVLYAPTFVQYAEVIVWTVTLEWSCEYKVKLIITNIEFVTQLPSTIFESRDDYLFRS